MGAALVVLSLLAGSGSVPGAGASAGVPDRTTAAVDTWLPRTGPVFNSPTGDRTARVAILSRVHEAIRHTPRGQTIRMASYNIDRRDTADLLIKAKSRGVNVQIVVNANLIGPVEKRLQSRLGKDRHKSSFLVICKNACRNGSSTGNMHMKVYSFSQAGAAKGVIINSSANLGSGAVNGQWNDAFTVYGNTALYDTWVTTFRQLRLDRTFDPRRVRYRSETLGVYYQRPTHARETETVTVTNTGDAPVDRLRAITCATSAGYGLDRRTVIRINMYAWYGARGIRIAREVAARKRAGCKVAVIGSVIADDVVKVLRGAGILVKAADWDWGQKLSTSGDKMVYGPRCYSHLKYVTINGTYKGKATRVVLTGSENWSAPALSSDEVTYEIHNSSVLSAYNKRWRAMWDSPNATHSYKVKPTRRPCY